MGEQEFLAARWLAGKTKRPDTAFAMLVALSCLPCSPRPAVLANLIGVNRSAISEVALDLENLGVLTRTWSEAESERAKEHGRFRLFSLVNKWPSVALDAKSRFCAAAT